MADAGEYSFGIHLDWIEADERRLSLGEFLKTVQDLKDILSALEDVAVGQRVTWDFDSDPTVRVVAHVNGVDADQLNMLVGRALETFRESASSNVPSVGVPADVHKKAVRVLNRFRRVADVEVTATGREPLVIEHADSSTRGGRPAFFYEQSSVEGTLEIINVHGAPHFVIFEHGTGKKVRCSMPDEWLKDVVKSLSGRVVVNGTVKYRYDGSPVSIRDVSGIEPVRDPEVSVLDLRGSIPGMTGDISSGEFVRRLRRSDGEESD